jgi:hypothetical protein
MLGDDALNALPQRRMKSVLHPQTALGLTWALRP